MPSRIYPKVRIGSRFGDRTVVEVGVPDPKRRSDERVRWRCACGREGNGYVFNLRVYADRGAGCRHVSGGRTTAPFSEEDLP